MAHEIDTTTGRAAVFVTGQAAWHGLGRMIEHAATSREAIRHAGLDWHVEQWPLTAADPEGRQSCHVPEHMATVRTDTGGVLGVVGRGYHVFQNRESFDFMDAIVGDKLAMYETAGSLKGGRRVWMLARIPREYRAGAADVVWPYVLLVNSHDGSTALRMIPTTVRVVCQNTLNLALRRSSATEGITLRHRPKLEERVKEARTKLGVVAARFDAFDEELHAMIATTMSPAKVEAYFTALLPPPGNDRQKVARDKVLNTFLENFENRSNTLRGVRGTPWAAYNAVSEWADHQRTFRGRDDHQRAESRLNSVWFGSSNAIKQRAYHSALELAGMPA